MLEAVLVLFGIGSLCGIVLSVASKVFYVWEDPRIAEVESHLAGANCGGCGYAGCSAAAVAVVAGKAPAGVCIISDMEGIANVAAKAGLVSGCPTGHGALRGRLKFPDAGRGGFGVDHQLRWFSRWLKGEQNGIDQEPPVRIFVMGENRWRDEEEWPLTRTQFSAWYFHSDGDAGRAGSRCCHRY